MEVAIPFIINIITWLTKQYIKPKYGKTGVQVFVFILALIGASIMWFSRNIASFELILRDAGIILAFSIAMYETLWSKLNFSFDVDFPENKV